MSAAITEKDLEAFTKVWLQISPDDHAAFCQYGREYQTESPSSAIERKKHFVACVKLAALSARCSLSETKIVDVQEAWKQLDLDAMSGLPSIDGSLKSELESHREYVGDRVRKIRRARRLTQKQLAELASLTQAHVSQIEKGTLCVTYQTIAKLAVALKVAMYDLDCSFDDPGQRVQSLRLSKQLTTKTLARHCGVSHERIEQIESGGGPRLSSREISALAKALSTTEDDLDPTYSVRKKQQ